ncbi:hypothetical protein P8935_24080 [Telmatobacter sp. DSM 110680]|uniref:Uncharacterized protein n=1 Tax=Telmatobacter sp. DSM 110680 TaxID=3036704 RepID=A0AAU7DIR1_9BACT
MPKIVWDSFGRPLGSVQTLPDGKRHVYDKSGQPLGNVSNIGTVDARGKLLSRTPMPGLLLNLGKQKK